MANQMSDVIRRALVALNERISEGGEFPDAHADVVLAFHMSDKQAEELREAYDAQG